MKRQSNEREASKRPFVIALTGGIATGKSTVAALLAERGAIIVDADRIAREVVEPGRPALAEIQQAFGSEVIGDDGRLLRSHLGARVFADPEARRVLEGILHPRIRKEMEARVDAAPADAMVVVDVPLLFETGSWLARADVVLVVYADRSLQEERLRARDGLEDVDVERRLDAQWPTARKLAQADVAIYNQGSRESLIRQVDDVWEQLLAWKEASGRGTAPGGGGPRGKVAEGEKTQSIAFGGSPHCGCKGPRSRDGGLSP